MTVRGEHLIGTYRLADGPSQRARDRSAQPGSTTRSPTPTRSCSRRRRWPTPPAAACWPGACDRSSCSSWSQAARSARRGRPLAAPLRRSGAADDRRAGRLALPGRSPTQPGALTITDGRRADAGGGAAQSQDRRGGRSGCARSCRCSTPAGGVLETTFSDLSGVIDVPPALLRDRGLGRPADRRRAPPGRVRLRGARAGSGAGPTTSFPARSTPATSASTTRSAARWCRWSAPAPWPGSRPGPRPRWSIWDRCRQPRLHRPRADAAEPRPRPVHAPTTSAARSTAVTPRCSSRPWHDARVRRSGLDRRSPAGRRSRATRRGRCSARGIRPTSIAWSRRWRARSRRRRRASASWPLRRRATETPPTRRLKNLFNTIAVSDWLRNVKTLGVLWRDEATKVVAVGEPMGVVAALIPVTNPTSTVIFKTLSAVKAGNAIVHAPHPRGPPVRRRDRPGLAEAAEDVGAPAGLIQCLSGSTSRRHARADEPPPDRRGDGHRRLGDGAHRLLERQADPGRRAGQRAGVRRPLQGARSRRGRRHDPVQQVVRLRHRVRRRAGGDRRSADRPAVAAGDPRAGRPHLHRARG